MNKKDVTIYWGLSVAIYSMGYVSMSAFSSVFLLDVGLTNGGIGVLLAVSSLLSVFLQPFTGKFIDRNGKYGSRDVLLALAMMVLAVGLMILFIPGKSLAVTTVLYGVDVLLLMLAQPFFNSLATDAINSHYSINIGAGRSIGSLGYAIGSYVFGQITVLAGPKCIPVIYSAAFFVLCLMLYFCPFKVEQKVVTKEEKNKNPLEFLGKYKRFAVMLIGMILVYFSHCLINTFALQIVVPKGGDSGTMGTASSIAAGFELITAFLFVYYMRKIKLHRILQISGIFFALKTFLSFAVTTVPGFYLIQATQMYGWGFMSVAIVYYVNDLAMERDKAQGQAFAGMSFTIASVLATSLGGNIIDLFGVNAMLLTDTASAVLGTIIIWFTAKEVTAK